MGHVDKHFNSEFPVISVLNKADSDFSFSSYKDNEIWELFRNGDDKAFIYIYSTYFPKLYNYGHHLVQDTEEVKDQIQDLFIYLRKCRQNLGKVHHIRLYLYKALRGRLVGNKIKMKLVSLFETGDLDKGFEIAFEKSPEQQLIENDLSEIKYELINKSLHKLTLRQREAVIYFYYEGLSYREIAQLMNLNQVKTARKLIYRALESMRAHLS
ncbi:MAG: RNA polymerase sigma factor [Cyclobacteriaceae bacterium]